MMLASRCRQRLLPLFLLALVLPSFAAAQNQGTAALLPLTGKQITQDEADILTDALIDELQKTGSFQMMERSQMDQILKEQGFQQSGACDGSQCAIEMGRLLGIQRMLTGSIGRLGNTYVLSARMVDVKTGAILKSTSRNVKGSISDCLSDLLPGVAKDLAKGEARMAAKPDLTGSVAATPKPDVPKDDAGNQSKTKIWPWVAGGAVLAGGAAAAILLLGTSSSSATAAGTGPGAATVPVQETVQMQAGWEVVK